MTEKKAHEVDRWLAKPDPGVAVVLLFGPDRGLVSERAAQFVRSSGFSVDDPFSVTRLQAAEIEQDPGRLADEANAISMFSERRLVWIRDAGTSKALAESVGRIADRPPAGTLVLIEGSDLKKGASLRTVVASASAAVGLPCFADDARSIDAIIDQQMEQAGLTITIEARQALKRNLGGDRLASRSEIEKLITYSHGARTVTIEDVQATAGDAASVSADLIADMLLAGRSEELDLALSRFLASGSAPFLILSALLRSFQALHALRGTMDESGKSPAAAVASARPTLFFARRAAMEAALSGWTRSAIEMTLDRIHQALLATRTQPSLAEPLLRGLLLSISASARRKLK